MITTHNNRVRSHARRNHSRDDVTDSSGLRKCAFLPPCTQSDFACSVSSLSRCSLHCPPGTNGFRLQPPAAHALGAGVFTWFGSTATRGSSETASLTTCPRLGDRGPLRTPARFYLVHDHVDVSNILLRYFINTYTFKTTAITVRIPYQRGESNSTLLLKSIAKSRPGTTLH